MTRGNLRRAKIELHGLARCFYPHKDNNTTRKYATLILFLAWGITFVGLSFQQAQPPRGFYVISLLVATILGRMWDIEVSRLLGGNGGNGGNN